MAKICRPLKRSKTGLETEFHLIDRKGMISNRAKEVIETLRSKHKRIDVTNEIGQNMIEFGCYPDVLEVNPTMHLITSLQKAHEVADDHDLLIYPFATYPGRFTPQFVNKQHYNTKKKIWGSPQYEHAARAVGFHHHYALPKGVFDAKELKLKLMRRSKLERSMVGSYNFEIAADPALTLLAQSSPFYQGQLFAKDSRVIVYRGGAKLNYMEGLNARLQQIGGLPPYKQTVTDLLLSMTKRVARWKREVKKVAPHIEFDKLYPYKLDIGWHPVKINKHGTLEQRGMDINLLSNVVAITVLLKYCLREIQREFLEIVPADFAIDTPFKLEGNILYIPPHTYVRNHLQPLSAYNGYGKIEMQNYVKRFLAFARSATPKRYNKIIKPLYTMMENRESVSDRIIKYARSKGYIVDGKISNSDSAELALYYAGKFPKDLENTNKALQRVAML